MVLRGMIALPAAAPLVAAVIDRPPIEVEVLLPECHGHRLSKMPRETYAAAVFLVHSR
jgi:hypothetical protein